MIRLATFLPILSIILSGCGETPPPFPLQGAWQAGSLTVADSLWPVETSPIRLFLDDKDRYTLLWYGREREEGEWTLKYPSLLIQPADKTRRSLLIAYLDADSLVLQGTLDSAEIRLGFRRMADDPNTGE